MGLESFLIEVSEFTSMGKTLAVPDGLRPEKNYLIIPFNTINVTGNVIFFKS